CNSKLTSHLNSSSRIFITPLIPRWSVIETQAMTIFYIDDDDDDREFFIEAVRHINAEFLCYTAKDGRQALRELREMIVMPDFIFLDVNMPVMNGKQFLLEIKRQ